ncbi:MAG: hypothetical protein J2P30_01650 [Actinobacteria bacterium]|nr:hypothetical protein [Actinomycetota bacterium]
MNAPSVIRATVADLQDAVDGLTTGRYDAGWWDPDLEAVPSGQAVALEQAEHYLRMEMAEMARLENDSSTTGER